MKSKFTFAASILMGAFAMASFTACSSDDDKDGGDNGSTSWAYPSPTLVDTNGNRVYVSSIGTLEDSYTPFWTYSYDEAGNLSVFSCVDEFNAVVGTSTIVCTDYYDDDNYVIYVETGSNGLISKMREEWTDEWGSGEVKGTAETSFTYNEEKQLVSMSYQSSQGKDKYSQTISNTWKNGILEKTTETYVSMEDDWSMTGTETYTYNYGKQANPAKQYPIGMDCVLWEVDEIYRPLFFMGFMGVGPAYLPISIDYTHKSEIDNYTWTNKYDYTLNPNGTINTETEIDGEYGYESIEVYQWQYGKTTRSFSAQSKNIASVVKHKIRKNRVPRHKR